MLTTHLTQKVKKQQGQQPLTLGTNSLTLNLIMDLRCHSFGWYPLNSVDKRKRFSTY